MFSVNVPIWNRSKGQLISECPFEILDFPKIPKKIDRFLP